jgi:Cu-Zn family superoxide dismutase
MASRNHWLSAASLVALVAACGPTVSTGGAGGAAADGGAAAESAAAAMKAKPGTETAGTVTFTREGDKVRIVAVVSGVSPGLHGIHVHEKGDCSAPDFSSAGEHFNPDNKPHACPPDPNRHAGDLGNIEVRSDGTGRLELVTDRITLGTGKLSVIGKSVVLHDMKDDCATQPAGSSGTRIGCAPIESKPLESK